MAARLRRLDPMESKLTFPSWSISNMAEVICLEEDVADSDSTADSELSWSSNTMMTVKQEEDENSNELEEQPPSNPDDQLPPVAKLEKYAFSDIVFNRQMVARNILETLQSVIDCRDNVNAVISVMCRLATDCEPSVRAELIEQLPFIATYCATEGGFVAHVVKKHIVPTIIHYLTDINNQIRKRTQVSLLAILERGLVEKEQLEEQICHLVIQLTDSDNTDDHRTEAVTLMTKMTPCMGKDMTIRLYLSHFVRLCQDASFHVRKVCAANFGDFCNIVGKDCSEDNLLPVFHFLCEDGVWGVRKACAEVFMPVSCVCCLETRRHDLAPLFLNLLNDQSRWVRIAAFQALGPFISTFADPSRTGIFCSSDGVLSVRENRETHPNCSVCAEEKKRTDENCDLLQVPGQSVSSEQDFDEKASDENGGDSYQVSMDGNQQESFKQEDMEIETTEEASQCNDQVAGELISNTCKKPEEDPSSGENLVSCFLEGPTVVPKDPDNKPIVDNITPVTQRENSCLSEEDDRPFMVEECAPSMDAESKLSGDSESKPEDWESKQPDVADGKPEGDNKNNVIEEGYSLECKEILIKEEEEEEEQENLQESNLNVQHCPDVIDEVPPQHLFPRKTPDPQGEGYLNVHGNQKHLFVHIDNSDNAFNTFQYWRLPIPELEVDIEYEGNRATAIHVKAKSRDQETLKTYTSDLSIRMCQPDNLEMEAINKELKALEVGSNSDTSNLSIQTASVSSVYNRNETHVLSSSFNKASLIFCQGELSDVRKVRMNVLGDPDHESLNNLMHSSSTFGNSSDSWSAQDQDIIPVDLLERYQSMTDPSLAQNLDSEISRHCAFSLPAVALTLGRQFWPCIRNTYDTLASDMQWKVRKIIASCLHELATVLGSDIAASDLVPVFCGFLRDLDEVRVGVLQHLYQFLKVLRPSDRRDSLPYIAEFLKMDNQRNWRFRLALAEQLIRITELYSPTDVNNYLIPIAFELLKDKVCEVRHVSVKAIAVMLQRLSQSRSMNLCKQVLQELSSKVYSPKWSLRQLYAELCHEMVQQSSLSPPVFAEEILPNLLYLHKDNIANVRISVARCLSQSVLQEPYFLSEDSPHLQELLEAFRNLQTDIDRDVRYFAQVPPEVHTALWAHMLPPV